MMQNEEEITTDQLPDFNIKAMFEIKKLTGKFPKFTLVGFADALRFSLLMGVWVRRGPLWKWDGYLLRSDHVN